MFFIGDGCLAILITWGLPHSIPFHGVSHIQLLHLSCHIKVKWSLYRTAVAQRVGRGIALLLHDRGTRRGWVVSSTPRSHFTPGKDKVPILQENGWVPGPIWTGGKYRPHRDSIPDGPARSSVAIPTELPYLAIYCHYNRNKYSNKPCYQHYKPSRNYK